MEVSVIDTKEAVPSARDSIPDSTKSSMLLIYSLLGGGCMTEWLTDSTTRQERAGTAFIVA